VNDEKDHPGSGARQSVAVRIPASGVMLDGELMVPADSRAVVIFAHGSGSSRTSPRNRYVADTLNSAGLATLLFDLLTPAEEAVDVRTAKLRFDIGFLARRLLQATDWLMKQSKERPLKVGYFGASTGAAAALVAAAEAPHHVGAIVSRGGRPDLAGSALAHVQAPTLLIVGGDDDAVLHLNRQAIEQLRCEKRLEIIAGATHLFEEPGALGNVAHLARQWFRSHLGRQQERDAA